MKTNFTKILLVAFVALGLSAQAMAMSPAIESTRAPLLATYFQGVGLLPNEPAPGSKIPTGYTLELDQDGRVFAIETFNQNNHPIEETTQSLVYSQSDIARFKKSINQLHPNRRLVQDVDGPVICDAGPAVLSVVISRTETVLVEKNDCSHGRVRSGRSKLELQVIDVLEAMKESYEQIRFGR